MFVFATNVQNIFKRNNWVHHYINMPQLCMEQNECSADRNVPVMVLFNRSSSCREVMKSCKLLATYCSGLIVSVSDRQ